MVFIAQLIYLCLFKRKPILFLITSMHILTVILIVLLVFKGIPLEPGANHAIHPGIIYRAIVFLKNLIINSIGIGQMEVSINNIPSLLNEWPAPLFTIRNLVTFSFSLFLLYICIKNIKQNVYHR